MSAPFEDQSSPATGQTSVLVQQKKLAGSIEVASIETALEPPDCGDFHDAFEIPDGSGDVGVLLGDVTGHGAVAARRAETIRAEAVSHLKAGDAPAEVISAANDAAQHNDDRYATLIVGRLDSQSGLLRYASAGHEPGIVAHRSSEEIEELETTGPPIGVLPSGEDIYEERRTLIHEGSTLVLTTDGVSEARTSAEGDVNFFGRDRLKSFVGRCKSLPLAALVQHLVALLVRFTRSHRSDDMAIMAVRRNSQSSEEMPDKVPHASEQA